MQYPNGMSNSYQYDSLNRLTNLVWAKSTNIVTFYYQLGQTGNRTNLQEVMPGAVSRTNRWSYDAVYKLALETISTNSTLKSLGYTYDYVGNRLTRSATNFADVGLLTNQSFTYNTNDWLNTDGYDNNGNTTNSAGTNYGYDAENRLTNVTCGSYSVTIVYNGDGQRVSKTVGSTTTLYLVDTHNLTGYAQVLEESQVNSGITNLTRAYTYGLSLISQRLLGSSGSTNFFGTDGHGSVRFLTSTNGTVSDTFTYDAFGTLIASTGTNANNYLYSGEQWDWDIGLYFLRARYMNPNTGRFWTMDTFEGNNEDPLSLHKYLYCQGNSVNGIDPGGHDLGDVLLTAAIGATIGGFSAAAVDIAQGRTVTAASIIQGAALGAVLGPLAAYVPAVGVGLGIGGVVYSGISFGPILLDPNATPAQRVTSGALIFASMYGATKSFAYVKAVNAGAIPSLQTLPM
jgi:RHS repeat-associated protein